MKTNMRWDILAKLIKNHKVKTFVEVGTANAKNLNHILNLIKDLNLRIWSIDPYESYDEYPHDRNGRPNNVKSNYQEALNTAFKDPRVIHSKRYSKSAASQFKPNSIDLIFIDANHTYKYVLEDIKTWLPIVRPGGIICGHDYRNTNGVVKAVNEAFSNVQKLDDTVWLKIKEEL